VSAASASAPSRPARGRDPVVEVTASVSVAYRGYVNGPCHKE
jgi:hypothetical protein